MAFRTWARIMLAALGVAALAGASQLGLAYGLGLVRLTRIFEVTARDQWTAQLAWVAWFAMVAAVIGALVAGWLVPRWHHPAESVPPDADPSQGTDRLGVGTMVGLACAAAIGAAIVVPLTMQPARTAQVIGVNPALVIGICAGLGAVIGAFAGYAALAAVTSRWSLSALITAVWVIAIVSVVPSLGLKEKLPAVRLGVFDAGYLSPATTQRTALFTMPALALLAGAAVGWIARRQGRPPLIIALAGLPGPALLTLAYLIAGPGDGDQRYQVVPYWAAMTATGAGVLGSVLAAVLRRGGQDDEADGEPAPTTDSDSTAVLDANDPPLPHRPAEPADPDSPGPLDPPTTDPDDAPTRPDVLAETPRTRRLGRGRKAAANPPAAPDSAGPAAPAAPDSAGPAAPARPDPFGPELNPPGSFRREQPLGGLANRFNPRPPPTGPGAAPYVPAPAIPPFPPEAAQQDITPPPPSRFAGGNRGRGPRNVGSPTGQQPSPFASQPQQVAPAPAVPHQISSPLPNPDPVSAPLPTPEPITPPTTHPAALGVDAEGRRGARGAPVRKKDEDYVDWVSGLGSD